MASGTTSAALLERGVTSYDVIVIGAGAAGLMCAIEAGKRGRRVALLEHQEKVGKKIAISGGGRCNFTNIHATATNYLSAQPDFCKSALARYSPTDFIALLEQHRISYHEKKLGQQFCDNGSGAIIKMLVTECEAALAEIRLGCVVSAVRKSDRFILESNHGAMQCQALVIATGGLSFPKLGATDFGYRVAEQFGLRRTPLRPALVPLTLAQEELATFQTLSGVSVPVVAHHDRREFEEAMLFTHRGLSGPAILQVSSYWREGEPLHLNLLPGKNATTWMATARRSKRDIVSALAAVVPRRFAEVWCERHAPAKPLQQYKAPELAAVAQLLSRWPIAPAGTEGYAKAEVTLGGIDTTELSSRTMESRKLPGLFFIGEVVDVTGWLGGYNFQWAWASGHAAGQFV
jgi:predicted Rossmann fold flavoprotein